MQQSDYLNHDKVKRSVHTEHLHNLIFILKFGTYWH